MKKNSILLISAALLMLAGCTVDELAGSKDGQIPVRLSVSQEATITRAADGLYTNMTGFDGNEQVEVYVNNNDKHATFTVGTPDGEKKSALTGTLYYPTSGDVNLYAVYPAASTASHTVKYNQTTDANYKASDLMYAKKTVTQANKTSTQELQFGHQLVKLKVVIVKAAGVSAVTKVEMKNVKRKVSVSAGTSSMSLTNLASATGETGTGANSDKILVFSGSNTLTSEQTYAVVFPVQSWSNQDFITVTADGKEATYKLTKNNFAAGSEYTLTLNINATALNNTVSITNWTGNQGSCEVQPTVTKLRAVITPEGAIPGLFTINADGDQVFFSKGNLQAKIASYASNSATASEWKFADSQYSYIGNAAGNNSFAVGSWVDYFCWVGSSASKNTYGLITFTSISQADHGNVSGESLKTDWGTAAASSIGSGWRTLTKDEWGYLFNTRTNASSKWGYGTVGGKNGIILLPDDFTDPMKNNGSGAFVGSTTTGWTANVYSTGNWSAMESAGCVFLPAAGDRSGTSVYDVGLLGDYWSSTANGADDAYRVHFYSGGVLPASFYNRGRGFSVRLVRPVPSN